MQKRSKKQLKAIDKLELSMLVLTRNAGESIIVGDKEMTITVLAVKGDNVKLGIKAPKQVIVHREEIYNRIQEHNKVKAND